MNLKLMQDSAIPVDKRSKLEEICEKYFICKVNFIRPYSSGRFHITINTTQFPSDLVQEVQALFPKQTIRVRDVGVVGTNGYDEEVHRFAIENIR